MLLAFLGSIKRKEALVKKWMMDVTMTIYQIRLQTSRKDFVCEHRNYVKAGFHLNDMVESIDVDRHRFDSDYRQNCSTFFRSNKSKQQKYRKYIIIKN